MSSDIDLDAELPVTPYDGSSGWTSTETSRDRATTEDSDGTTARRQRHAIAALAAAATSGLTWRELATLGGMHHGQASAVLTVMHKTGKIARLSEKRERCRVYVLPECTMGRETEPYVARVQPATVDEMTETIREAYAVLSALGVFDDE